MELHVELVLEKVLGRASTRNEICLQKKLRSEKLDSSSVLLRGHRAICEQLLHLKFRDARHCGWRKGSNCMLQTVGKPVREIHVNHREGVVLDIHPRAHGCHLWMCGVGRRRREAPHVGFEFPGEGPHFEWVDHSYMAGHAYHVSPYEANPYGRPARYRETGQVMEHGLEAANDSQE